MARMPAKVRVNAQFPFPALVQGSGPITLAKATGIWTVGFSSIAFNTIVPQPADYATEFLFGQNSANGAFFKVSISYLISTFSGLTPTFVTSGATYNSVATDTRILVNKTVGSATSIVLAASASYFAPVLVKDLKGDASSNPITVTFTGGQLVETLASVVISTDYGSYWFNPLAAGGWYLT